MIPTILSLPQDIHSTIIKKNPSLPLTYSKVNRLLRSYALNSFLEADRTMMQTFPAFLPTIDSQTIPKDSALRLFKRLVNHVHDEARHLECDQSPEKDLSPEGRMEWECEHFEDLVQVVVQKMEIAKTEDFNTFVEVVALAVQATIPEGMNPREFWEQHLKDDDKIKQLTQLSLLNKGIRYLPPEIASLSNLKMLYLGGNQIKEIPSEFASFAQLEIIDLTENQLRVLPDVLPLPLSLQHLRLNKNKLRDLPEAFGLLPKLNYLDLSENPLNQIPSAISALPKLKYLHLYKVGIEQLSDPLTLPMTLEELVLSGNRLTELSDPALNSLSGLHKLFLNGNPLTEETKDKLRSARSAGKDIRWDQPLPPRWDE